MNGIFKRLNNKKGSQKHPNSDYFFFQVLNDFSPLPYFYWWGNFLFIIFYYFTFNIFKLNAKITVLSKNNNLSKINSLINDGFTIFIIFMIVALSFFIVFKGLSGHTKNKIQNGKKWAQTGEDNVTSVELKSLRRLMILFLLFIYLAIPFLLFRDLPLKEFWQHLINNSLGNFLFLEVIYISILTIFTSYLISKEF
jgi:hypothetical protein